MIIASAIKLSNGRVFVGKRHNDVFSNIKYFYKNPECSFLKEMLKNHIQGFINDELVFKTREEALIEAKENNQIINGETIASVLTSEDLW